MTHTRDVRRRWPRRLLVLTGLAGAGLSLAAGNARAGCVVPGRVGSSPNGLLRPDPNARPNLQEHRNLQEPATIVGLWYVEYTATSSTSGPLPVPVVPPGSFPFLQSYKTWHADGTEFENALLPPAAGNFCFGVWRHTGQGSVKLHHTGVMYAPEGNIANIFTVDEIDRVAPDGATYTGTFDLRIYAPTDVLGAGAVLQEIAGATAATRIVVR